MPGSWSARSAAIQTKSRARSCLGRDATADCASSNVIGIPGSLLHGWRAVNFARPGPIRRSNLDLSGSLESFQRQRVCFERTAVLVGTPWIAPSPFRLFDAGALADYSDRASSP